MIWVASLLIALVCTAAWAQDIPAGTAIPVMVSTSINASKDSPGKHITGEVMEEVQIGDDLIKERARVNGHLERIWHAKESGAIIVIVFDEVTIGGKAVPLKASLIALASMTEVAWAQDPINTGANTLPENEWVMRQVGGDVVHRGRRVVESSLPWGPTGKWIAGTGVRMRLTPSADAGCHEGPGYNREQSLWVFSSNACGAYGWKDLRVERERVPAGAKIILRSPRNINIRGGSGWLLITLE